MSRVLTTDKLKVYIREREDLHVVVKNSTSPKDLERNVSRVSYMQLVCLVDIDWNEVFNDLKEV